MPTLHYSILKYTPIATPSASIILGILFHEPSIDHREFRFTTDLSHLSQFEPEVDVAMVEKLLQGIKEDIGSERFDSKGFDIEDYTRFYINDFRFEEVQIVMCDDVENMVDYLVEFHLK